MTQYQNFVSVTINRNEIKNADYNPRKISPTAKRKLKATLGDPKIGLLGGIVWNKRTGNLVGGHKRIEQLDSLEGNSDYKITVAMTDMDEESEKVANIVLNNTQIQGEFDIVLLEDVMSDILESGTNPEKTGFSPADFQFMFSDEFNAAIFGGDQAEQYEEQDGDIEALNAIFDEGADDRRMEREEAKIRKEVEEEVAAEAEESGGMSDEEKKALEIEKLKEYRKKFRDKHNAENTPDKTLTLVFSGPTQIDAFLRFFKQPLDSKIVDAYPIMDQIGIEYQEYVDDP